MLSLFSITEFIDFCIPDALPISYTTTYIFSILSVLLIRLIQGFLNLGDNSTINTLYILSTNAVVVFIYGLDVFVYNVQSEEFYAERSTEVVVEIQGVENPIRESTKKGTSFYIVIVRLLTQLGTYS